MASGNQTLFGLLNTLSKYQKMNFVKRILDPDNSPKLYDNEGGILGPPSTHSMAWGEADGKYYVFPTVIEDAPGRLKRLPGDLAFDHAMRSGEAIPFDTPDDADWFSKNYKRIWHGK